MAAKEHLKKAVQLEGGGLKWTWPGQGEISHEVTWHKNGQTFWSVLRGDLVLRTEEPWFLVQARGEVQENIKHYRNAGLDVVMANRALIAADYIPDQHMSGPGCVCYGCKPLPEYTPF